MTVSGPIKKQRRKMVAATAQPERPTGVNFGHWRSLEQRRLHERINERGMRERRRELLDELTRMSQDMPGGYR